MQRPFLLATLAAAAVFLGFGVSLPLIELKRLYVFGERPSLLGMVTDLARDGDIMLAIIVALFSVVLPGLKIAVLGLSAWRETVPDAPSRLKALGSTLARWSMLDVLLVALVVFAAKTSGLASVTTQPGFWCFAASVFLAALAGAAMKAQ